MINFFKAEDFDLTWNDKFGNIQSLVAAQANAKLEREGKVMFGVMGESRWHFYSSQQIPGKTPQDTHKALLINIEPIEECKHPIEKIKANDPNVIHGFICLCGVKVRATSFEVVE